MAKVVGKNESTDVTTKPAMSRNQELVASMPSHLQQETEDFGVDVLKNYIRPPRIKVKQKSATDAYADFDVGDVIVVPDMTLIAPIKKDERGRATKDGEPFYFVPVFFFPEYCLWNPYEAKGTLPAVKARSLDPKSELAIRANNPDMWAVPCVEMPTDRNGKQLYCRYVEHLNYVIMLMGDHELAGTPLVLPFFRAEHKAGTTFAQTIAMRKTKAMFANVFQGEVHFRSNAQGDWMGIDVVNPSKESGVSPWVEDTEVYAKLKERHLELREAHAAKLIFVDYEEDEGTESNTVNSSTTEY